MKKLLSVFLTLAMMLTMLSLPLTSVSAVESESQSSEIYDTSKAVDGVLTLDGVPYTVINEANKTKFFEMSGSENYILGADLDFTVDGTPTAWGAGDVWYGTLEGNGHTVTGFSVDQGGMFNWYTDVTASIKIANVTFGAPGALINVAGNQDDVSTGLLCGHVRYGSKTIEIENVQAYVQVTRGSRNEGGLIGQARHSDITFTNCLVDGTITGTGNFRGGYIGLVGSGNRTVTFNNCINSLDHTYGNGYNGRGGFVGLINASGGVVTVNNCINEGKIACSGAATGTSALVGSIEASGNAQPLFVTGFLNLGTFVSETSAPETVGVVVGSLPAEGVEISVENVVTTNAPAGGNTHGNPTLVTSDDLASGKAASLLGKGFGQEMGVETMPKIGGMPVIERVIGEDTYYGNVIDCEDDKATVYAQFTADNGGSRNHRVLIAVPEAYLAEVTSVTFRVTYTLTAGGTAVV